MPILGAAARRNIAKEIEGVIKVKSRLLFGTQFDIAVL
jgi:hypothetical protein